MIPGAAATRPIIGRTPAATGRAPEATRRHPAAIRPTFRRQSRGILTGPSPVEHPHPTGRPIRLFVSKKDNK
jgi:hypothetical protein